MRVITRTNELTNDDLRLLSDKTGKSVKTLKRLKNTHNYLVYTSDNNSYDFFGHSLYVTMMPKKSIKDFYRAIQEYQLSQML